MRNPDHFEDVFDDNNWEKLMEEVSDLELDDESWDEEDEDFIFENYEPEEYDE